MNISMFILPTAGTIQKIAAYDAIFKEYDPNYCAIWQLNNLW